MAFAERYTTVYTASTSVELKQTSRFPETKYSSTSSNDDTDLSLTNSYTTYQSTGAHSLAGLSINHGLSSHEKEGNFVKSTRVTSFDRHNENLKTFETSFSGRSTKETSASSVSTFSTGSTYSGTNTRYNSSSGRETKNSTGFEGKYKGTTDGFSRSVADSASIGLEVSETQTEVYVFQTQAGSGSRAGGTTSLSGETHTSSSSASYRYDVSSEGEPATVKLEIQTLYEYDGTNRSVTVTSKESTAGGISYTLTTESREESAEGLTENRVIENDPDDNTSDVVLSAFTTTFETTSSATGGVIVSNNTSSSTSFVEAYPLDTLGTSYGVLSDSTYEVDSDETTTTSTHVSDVYYLHSSLSNTDTFKIYTSTNTSNTDTDVNTAQSKTTKEQTREVYTTSTSTETESIITIPYDYEYFLINTIHYEGGVGIFGDTGTESIEERFTSFSTHSTSFSEATLSVPVTTTEYSLALSKSQPLDSSLTTETDLTSANTVFTTTKILHNTISETSAPFYDFPDPHPASATRYLSHGFLEATKETYGTHSGPFQLIYEETTMGPIRSTSTDSINRIQNRSQTLDTTTITGYETHTLLQTYFNLTEISTFESTTVRTLETTSEVLINIGSDGASVTKKFVNGEETYNTLSDDNFNISLATYFSTALGFRFLSTDTSELSDRKNLNPPSIKYTEDFLTTTHQTYPMMSGSQSTTTGATIYTSSTRSAESWNMPGASEYKLQGFRFIIRDNTMSVHDPRECSITYSGGSETIASRATITGTYTTVFTTGSSSDDTFTVSSEFSNTESIFRSLIENIDGCEDIGDVTTILEDGIRYSTSANHFGGKKDYTNNGILVYSSNARLTLVTFNSTGGSNTTEIKGKLSTESILESTTMDTHRRFFLSTKTEYLLGRFLDSMRGSSKAPLATSTYGRLETNYP